MLQEDELKQNSQDSGLEFCNQNEISIKGIFMSFSCFAWTTRSLYTAVRLTGSDFLPFL